jgi:hypothetical protein
MYVLEESNCAIIPMKLTNNEDKTSAEWATLPIPLKPKQGLNGPPDYQRADDLDVLDLVLVDGVELSG